MGERKEVVYDTGHWEDFRRLRSRAQEILCALEPKGLDAMVFGSVARGDVKPSSDVDIFIPQVASSMQVMLALDDFTVLGTTITQATPRSLVKANVELEDNTSVTFPLIPPREVRAGVLPVRRSRRTERGQGWKTGARRGQAAHAYRAHARRAY